ncbi:hypothetical protein J7J58_05560 [candidate division WOR-3 bacterium]|nr:hypothetical protein [candidate division WOR-3 bacterium]
MSYYLFPINAVSKELSMWSNVSSILTILGTLTLWITFMIMGFIARKYEMVLHKETDWQFMVIAPSGLLLYALISAYAFIFTGSIKMNSIETWVAYSLFGISAILTLLGVYKFYKVVNPKRRR